MKNGHLGRHFLRWLDFLDSNAQGPNRLDNKIQLPSYFFLNIQSLFSGVHVYCSRFWNGENTVVQPFSHGIRHVELDVNPNTVQA